MLDPADIPFIVAPDMDPAAFGYGLEQGGFSGAVLADKKSYRSGQVEAFGFCEDFQIEGVTIPGRELIAVNADTFYVHGAASWIYNKRETVGL
jgi:hypothetical protein